MTHRSYEPDDAKALAPLLDSIGRELQERAARLAEIELRLDETRAGSRRKVELARLESEASEQRRELRHCREELENLGCSVVGTTPLTVRIPTHVGNSRRSLVWQHGQAGDD